MLPTPIGVSNAPLLGRAPPDSASCADSVSRHPRVAASDVFPRGGNSRERARARRWLGLASQAARTELDGRMRGHGCQIRVAVPSVSLDPGNENRVTMVVVRAPHEVGRRTATTSGRDSQGGVSIRAAKPLSRGAVRFSGKNSADDLENCLEHAPSRVSDTLGHPTASNRLGGA